MFSLTESFSLHHRLLAALFRWCFTWRDRAGASITSPPGAIPLTKGRKAAQRCRNKRKQKVSVQITSKQIPVPASVGRAKTSLELHHISDFYLLSAPSFDLGLLWPSPGRLQQHHISLANHEPVPNLSVPALQLCKVMRTQGDLPAFYFIREMPGPVHGVKIPATINVSQHRSRRAHIFSALSESTTDLGLHSNYSNLICHTEKEKKISKKATSWVLSAGQLSPWAFSSGFEAQLAPKSNFGAISICCVAA